jgi:dihydrofolate reductase
MTKVLADISMSLDGYVAGPHDGLGRGLGEGGEPLHNWVMGGAWTYADDPSFNATGADREVIDEAFGRLGAVVVGRRMYDVVDGWGDEDTFGMPCFVVTSRPAPSRTAGKTSYTFVTDGIGSALEQARASADDKDVAIMGGARLIQQYLAAELIDELQIHFAPLLLGGGTRLFNDDVSAKFEIARVVDSPMATHVRYRVLHASEAGSK